MNSPPGILRFIGKQNQSALAHEHYPQLGIVAADYPASIFEVYRTVGLGNRGVF